MATSRFRSSMGFRFFRCPAPACRPPRWASSSPFFTICGRRLGSAAHHACGGFTGMTVAGRVSQSQGCLSHLQGVQVHWPAQLGGTAAMHRCGACWPPCCAACPVCTTVFCASWASAVELTAKGAGLACAAAPDKPMATHAAAFVWPSPGTCLSCDAARPQHSCQSQVWRHDQAVAAGEGHPSCRLWLTMVLYGPSPAMMSCMSWSLCFNNTTHGAARAAC